VNAFTVLSSFVSFTEGYLGLWPNIELWDRLHGLRTKSVQDPSVHLPKPMVECGATMILPRRSTKFIRVTGLETCWKWQKTFFYVKNAGDDDFINLPAYIADTPDEKHNWSYNHGDHHAETNQIYTLIQEMRNTGIPSPDETPGQSAAVAC
jgi:hypothetical protein